MFKTLAAKAIVPVALSITGFVVVCCILLYASMKDDRIEENILHANDIASVLVNSTRYAMLKDDRETLRSIVSNVGGEKMVEHVRIFNKLGLVVFSSAAAELGREVNKDAEGCSLCHSKERPVEALGPMEQARRFVNEKGDHVLAITAAIYNGPDCSSAGCHYHSPEQSVLGTLDIGLSEENLQRNLLLMRHRLTIFSFMVLLLSIGGVAALLRMNVVMPIRQLADYVRCLAAGGEPKEPPSSRDELGDIARSALELRRRVNRLNGNGRG